MLFCYVRDLLIIEKMKLYKIYNKNALLMIKITGWDLP